MRQETEHKPIEKQTVKPKPIVGVMLEDIVGTLGFPHRAQDSLVSMCNRADKRRGPVGSSVQSSEMQRLMPYLRGKLDEVKVLLSRDIQILDGELIVHPYREPVSVAA